MWRGVIFIGCRIVKHPMTHTSGILPRISSTRTRVRSDLIQTATDPERSLGFVRSWTEIRQSDVHVDTRDGSRNYNYWNSSKGLQSASLPSKWTPRARSSGDVYDTHDRLTNAIRPSSSPWQPPGFPGGCQEGGAWLTTDAAGSHVAGVPVVYTPLSHMALGVLLSTASASGLTVAAPFMFSFSSEEATCDARTGMHITCEFAIASNAE
eukprot:1192534-Prorocentrum_minimum.AAC.2